jgi:hypothetical protein
MSHFEPLTKQENKIININIKVYKKYIIYIHVDIVDVAFRKEFETHV